MAFSTFVFDTLDVSMRLGRYIVQELCGCQGAQGALAGTLITVAIPIFLLIFGGPGRGRFLDALRRVEPAPRGAHAAVDHGLAAPGAQAHRVHAAADVVRSGITLWALGKLALANLEAAQGLDVALVNALAAAALIALALFLVVSALCGVRAERRGAPAPARVA